jgi:hypothetical protein
VAAVGSVTGEFRMGKRRPYACLGLAAALVVGGTLAAGLLPQTPLYQVLAGGIIVAGFAVGYACVGAFDTSG